MKSFTFLKLLVHLDLRDTTSRPATAAHLITFRRNIIGDQPGRDPAEEDERCRSRPGGPAGSPTARTCAVSWQIT
jgi:hypothetical protein